LAIDSQPLFPDVCGETQNGFLVRENCFVGEYQTKQSVEKINNFNKMIPPTPGAG
jgi:hypothetical protein